MGRERRRIVFALIHSILGWKITRPSTCVKSLEICHDPYRDTVENGSTLGKSGIYDPRFDAKSPKPTPKNWEIDALQKPRSGRLCRPL